eukprot:jgi/Mesen1/4263/ME000022S03545
MAVPLVGAAAWHWEGLHVLYEILGWLAFATWSMSFYPQAILNYKRKSVVGFNFDFLVFNLTKHTSYLIFNASMFFSPVVQQQYHDKYGTEELIPVSASDVAFSTHAVLLTVITAAQVFFYEKGGQRVSRICWGISSLVWAFAAICLLASWPSGSWLWLVSVFNYLQLLMTSIKYIPQAWFNFKRRSTEGWSIGNILLDITGGLSSFLQMALQSIDQHSVGNFVGNVGKVGLSLETVAFDALFIVQHYYLYPESHKVLPLKVDDGGPEYERLSADSKNATPGQGTSEA